MVALVDGKDAAENGACFSAEELRWFPRALRALDNEGVPFMLVGAFGLYRYTGFCRNTNDMDLLILPEHRDRAIAAVTGCGLRDLFDEEPYDRDWIFRATRDGVIVDLIWQLANKADVADSSWFERAGLGEFLGMPAKFVSAADLCWMKLLVFQGRRCDWPDILNVIRGTRGRLDWDHLLAASGPHWRLLCAVTEIWDWLCPDERDFIPESFRASLENLRAANADARAPCHKDLLDSRTWLAESGAGLSNPAERHSGALAERDRSPNGRREMSLW